MTSTGPLHDKTALVIGGSRGIGRAVTERLAADGAAVAFSYVQDETAARSVLESIAGAGGSARSFQADLGDTASIRRLFDAAQQALGGIDIVVVNPGVVVIKPLADLTEEDYDRVFGVNARGTFFALQEAARRVRDGGRILATSTGGTRMLMTQLSAYLGSKAAVEQFVRVLARELGPRQVTVNAVSPGFTDTDMLPGRDRAVAASASPLGRVGKPEDVAETFAFLASHAGRWTTGQNIPAGGGVF
ncbi:MAG: SDR family oxidoreductase [Burkholderiales bacterium]|jgi:3-oxoacyl-[acyl-carrier protein] reductase|nr:SDR family oxidoreductase [Burkholderiales bacterium]